MSQLADFEIADLCTPPFEGRHGMIEPFRRDQIREIEDPTDHVKGSWIDGEPRRTVKAISFGVCSYGYDFTLAPDEFKVFHNAYGVKLVDPKNFDHRLLMDIEPTVDETGTWFVIPGNSYALGKTIEYVRMPRNLTAVSIGKSTYARCGLITNVTPFEAAWDGVVTLELANASPTPMKVYANEGIFQTIFFEGRSSPRVTYADRGGKYQGQTGLTLAKV